MGSNCSLTSSHPHCNFSQKDGQGQGKGVLAAGVWSTKRPRSVGSGEGGCHQPKPIGVLAAQLAADPTYTVTSTQAPNPPPAPSSCAWEGSGAEEGVTLWM